MRRIRIQTAPSDYGVLSRQEFVDEFGFRYSPGQHVIGLGPTGRGKTTLFSQILPHAGTRGVVISCLGADPTLQHLGKRCTGWPLRLPVKMYEYDEHPVIRRFEDVPHAPADFARIRAVNASILRWMFARPDWTMYFPDLQIITDPRMMNLGKEVEQLLLTLRKVRSSVWMDAQAPRWLPRAATDQVSHLILWKTRDEGTIKRLREIAGLDINLLLAMFADMDFHDALWVDVRGDEYFHVLSS